MHTALLASGPGRTWRRWASPLLALALPLLGASAAQAQSVANYVTAYNTGITYASIATTGTAITGFRNGTSTDDNLSGATPIGFPFVYDGSVYTQFSLSTNGFLTFNVGTAATGAGTGGYGYANTVFSAAGTTSTLTGTVLALAPFYDDLYGPSLTTDYRYLTTGTAPNRVLTAEWIGTGSGTTNLNFQVKLFEADGHIEFNYGTIVSSSGYTYTLGINAPTVSATPTAAQLLSLQSGGTNQFGATPSNALTTPPASNSQYVFTPPATVPTAPTGITFSGLSTTSATVNFTDASTTEVGFAVFLTPTAGGATTIYNVATTTGAGTGTAYTVPVTGLAPNTGYTVQVVALTEGRGSAGTAATGTFSTAAGATLNGTYYVGTGTSPQPTRTYATLTAAADAYNTGTLTGAVTFVLLDNSYSTAETFPIRFGSNSTASATNTLTIKPNTGVSATITGSVATGAVLMLNGADYVTIDGSNNGTTSQNLTLENASATGSGNAVLWLAAATASDGATFNTVKNTVIRGNSATGFPQFTVFLGGGGTGVAAPTTSTPAANSNNTFTNNAISKGYYGVFVFGTSATALDQNNSFVDNKIGQAGAANGFGQEGLRAVYQQGLTLRNNEIQSLTNGTTTANLYGIFLADTKGAVVSRNSVHNISYTGTSTTKVWGIHSSTTTFNTAANASANRFDNNLVYNINSTATSSTWNTVGINCGGGFGDQYYYNTVYLTGQLSAASGTAGSAAFANGNPSVTTTSTNIDVRNNIFSIIGGTAGTATTPLYAHYEQGTTVTGSTLNYNDLYVTVGTTGAARIGRLNAVDATTLAAWQTATGQEANSVSVDPQFVQTTTLPYDLTPGNVALNNVATPITGVTVDFTNATRGTTPDIGAYEFTPVSLDLAVAGLVGPVVSGANGTCFGAAEAVTVSVRNAGTTVINFATTPATITVVVTGPTGVATQTLTYTLNTGTLAAGATLSVPLTGTGTTVNLSTAGTYSFAITATVAGDGNAANNTLATSPTVVVSAPVAGTLAVSTAAICVSGTTQLTLAGALNGAVQLQSGTSATGPFTDITGATSGTYTTPVLTSTTYYRAQVTCGTTVVTSNVVTVTVNNPLVATTNTPVAICSGSTATLTATASTGASVRFFSTATGGTALTSTTPGSYTTPALTASTTYFAEAFSGSSASVGPTTNTIGTGLQSTAPQYLTFDVAQATVLTGVYMYPGAAGNLVVEYRSSTGTVLQTATVPVTTAQIGVKTFVPLGFNLVAGTAQRMGLGASSVSAYRNETGAAYPYTGGGITITGNSFSTTYYYWFYDWVVGSECVAASRTPIQVTVNPAANTAFTYGTATSFCASQTTAQAVVLGTGATAGTFTVSPATGLTINATTGAITPSTSTPGTYTVTNTVAASGSVCAGTSTATVTITAAPVATFSYPVTLYCQGAGTVAPILGAGATPGTFTSTAGLVINATTGAIDLSISTPGNYTVTNTVAASGACPTTTATAAFSFVARPATPVLTATYNGSTTTLTSSATTGNQFYFNNNVIPGATGQTYVITGLPAQLGSYTVVTTSGQGCASLPSNVLVVTAARGTIAGASLRVYPNPTPAGEVTLELTGFRSATTLTVLDAVGRVVKHEQLPANAGTATHSLDLSGTATGVYLLRLSNTEGVETRRLVRE